MLITALTLTLLAPQSPQVVDGVIVRPDWVQVPTVEQLRPEGIRNPTRSDYEPQGEVQLRCVLKVDGLVDDCRVIALSTAYPELGATALEAASHFRHAPRLADGRLAAGMPVLLKFRWSLGE